MNNVMVWLKGLLAAAISGAATTITVMIVAPETFNLDHIGKVGAVAGIGALLGVANYLKQSPIWKER